MGGYIGFGLSEYAPDRLAALIIGGAHPYARDQSGHRQLLREGIRGGGNAFVAAFERATGPIPENYAAKLRAADFRAWLAGAADCIGIDACAEKHEQAMLHLLRRHGSAVLPSQAGKPVATKWKLLGTAWSLSRAGLCAEWRHHGARSGVPRERW